MVNLTLVLASLCILSLISFSLSEFHTMKVQLEGEVTLQCSNFSTLISHIFWLKLTDGPNTTNISSMTTQDSNATIMDGFKERFLMTSNITHVFLNIKNLNSSDSGLYFCGYQNGKDAVIFDATYLLVYEVSRLQDLQDLQTIILGSIIGFLLMVIVILFMKIRSYLKAQAERQHKKNLDYNDLNYAAVNFRQKAKNRTKAAAESEDEAAVVYATTK